MARLTDEQLMAYADGDLLGSAPEIVGGVQAGLSVEEQSALEDFRRTRELVRLAYADDADPPSPALVAMILGRQGDAKDPVSARGTTERSARVFPTKLRSELLRPGTRLGLAMAACLAALFAAVFIWSLPSARTDIARALVPGPVDAGSELASILETRRSGDPIPVGRASDSREHLMVAGTFRDRNARICREFEVLAPDLVPRMAAVACRSSETGIWSVEGTATIAHQDSGDGSRYTPAGAPEQEALKALVSLLGGTDVVKPDEEQQLIDRAWK
ncbi:hypothetical protein [Hyphomicrobium sp.]|uniref:hypothetical protein n=1 Tax=Hyphomicrobium sp. TaxID=82 RepID=UPI0025C63D63|nr:hypothetical protein [Hyphomicrobium sp.]MCC7250971.1 hypothetical protein [Hyphomicrobium sp.]